MLTVESMLSSVSDITDINKVSISLYREFFNTILCERVFIYHTIDGKKIKLIFEESNFMHVLGAQHILGRNFKSTKFNSLVDTGEMTFEELDKRNPRQFADDIKRFFGFANIYHVLTNCEVIYFDKDVYENQFIPKKSTKMDYEYLLFQTFNSKRIHVGIGTYNRGRTYFGKSLLVETELNCKLTKDQQPIMISKIEVRDKKTNRIIEDIAISEVAFTQE